MTLTNLLIAVNVVVFLWELNTGGPGVDHGDLYGPAVSAGEWWRIVASAFEHGSYAHIGLNMFALYQVGNAAEAFYGRVRYALLYALALAGSAFAVLEFNYTTPTLGASGAIFGLFGALVAIGMRLGARGRGIVTSVLPVIVINLVFTLTFPGISIAAHVGGLLTGFLAGYLLYRAPQPPPVYAYAYPAQRDDGVVETIEHPPDAGPHEEAAAAPLETRDPRE